MEKLRNITEWLNENYNQDSEKYNIIMGAKPEVIRYDDETAVSFWACGAIVCIKSIMYFISEDDGHWFCPMYYDGSVLDEDGYVPPFMRKHPFMGLQNSFSLGWVDSFVNAMTSLNKFVEESGTPVYFLGTDVICNYTL